MIRQCKGKMLDKVPTSKLIQDGYYMSIKYDGNYCQIHKIGDAVTIYSSGNKSIKLDDLEEYLVSHNPDNDFILEAEFIGTSEGKLGDRTQCGIMTTWRINTAKGLSCNASNNRFVIFDIIVGGLAIFEERLQMLQHINLPCNLQIADFSLTNLDIVQSTAKQLCKDGWEGVFLKHKDHTYRPGKRVNDAIKIKMRPTADLLCIDIEPGEGKYVGMIGSLILMDSKGRKVRVGSGLNDAQRSSLHSKFLDKVIEVEYEQILDTYIQPTFIAVRADKTKKEID